MIGYGAAFRDGNRGSNKEMTCLCSLNARESKAEEERGPSTKTHSCQASYVLIKRKLGGKIQTMVHYGGDYEKSEEIGRGLGIVNVENRSGKGKRG